MTDQSSERPGEMEALHRAAVRLQARAKARLGPALDGLPPLFFLTDPLRTPDPAAAARRLPSGCGVIFRSFGAEDARETGRRLRKAADERGLVFLVGADVRLARALRADGVHLPERLLHRAAAIRSAWPQALLTGAVHSRTAIERAQRAGVRAVLLSPVFPSQSPSASRPLGVMRFAAMVDRASVPVYALGGVDAETAPMLMRTGAAGVAAVSAVVK